MILPQTEWVQPTEYPDLRSYDEIAIDLETRDPDLKSKGSATNLSYHGTLASQLPVGINSFTALISFSSNSSSIV